MATATLCLYVSSSPFLFQETFSKVLTNLIPGLTRSVCSELGLFPLGSLN